MGGLGVPRSVTASPGLHAPHPSQPAQGKAHAGESVPFSCGKTLGTGRGRAPSETPGPRGGRQAAIGLAPGPPGGRVLGPTRTAARGRGLTVPVLPFQFDKYAPKLDSPYFRHSSVSVLRLRAPRGLPGRGAAAARPGLRCPPPRAAARAGGPGRTPPHPWTALPASFAVFPTSPGTARPAPTPRPLRVPAGRFSAQGTGRSWQAGRARKVPGEAGSIQRGHCGHMSPQRDASRTQTTPKPRSGQQLAGSVRAVPCAPHPLSGGARSWGGEEQRCGPGRAGSTEGPFSATADTPRRRGRGPAPSRRAGRGGPGPAILQPGHALPPRPLRPQTRSR